jgi:hypothetical protein
VYNQNLAKRLMYQNSPARKAIREARGTVHFDPAESFQSPYADVSWAEPRAHQEPVIEYPSLPDVYDLPEPQAWSEGFHIPTPQEFFGPPHNDSFAPEEPSTLEDVEVIRAIEQVRSGDLIPGCFSGELRRQDRGQGLEIQLQPSPEDAPLQPRLEHLVTEPQGMTPELPAYTPPGLYQ